MAIQYLTPDEAALIFRVTRRTVYRWLYNRELPARKIGGSWRIDMAVIVVKQKEVK